MEIEGTKGSQKSFSGRRNFSGFCAGRCSRRQKMFCGINILIVISCAIIVSAVVIKEDSEPIVKITKLGTVKGSLSKTAWTEQSFYQFLGIPFAESPSGNLRFKPPVPKGSWDGIRDATQQGRVCPVLQDLEEFSDEKLKEDLEDCLHLSVYTKNFRAKFPVMVYIYGGGFTNGSTRHYPPNYLLEKDIVLVAAQYRLGALGFLSTRTSEIPGNMAIHDIIAALEWINKYIKYFGGDPKSVTIFGQSAGGIISNILAISPTVRDGLFHRVILQSGSLVDGALMDGISKAKDMGTQAECKSVDDINLLNDCLMKMPLKQLLEVSESNGTKLINFGPSLFDYHNILPATIPELLKHQSRKYPMMGGTTKHDGTFILAEIYDKLKDLLNSGQLKPKQIIDTIMDIAERSGSVLARQLLTKLLFTSDQLNNGDFKQLIPGLIDLVTVTTMKSPMLRMLQWNAEQNPQSTFLYSFDYLGEFTRFGYDLATSHYPFDGGVHHSDDTLYLFNIRKLNEQDTKISQMMVDLWTSFARFGVPKADAVPVWPSLTRINGPFLHINTNPSIGNDFTDEYTVTVRDQQMGITLVRP